MASAISSMTGFGRTDGAHEAWRWSWELKSVNSRGLEPRFRLPSAAESIEPTLRAELKKRLSRGSVFISLQLASDTGHARVRLNAEALPDILAALEKVRGLIDAPPPRAEAILGLRGVLEMADDGLSEAEQAALNTAIIKSFGEAADALRAAREKEGAAMAQILRAHLAEIESLIAAARGLAGASISAIRDRIAGQLAELIKDGAVPEERLAQEAALMAVKADVREELDRLEAHVAAARELMARGGPVGRELDFLTQEFNRETNTLCSKVQDIELKRTGLSLKKVIDQFREQVQNIE